MRVLKILLSIKVFKKFSEKIRDVKLFVRDKNYSKKLAKKLIKKGLLIQKFLFFMKLYKLANILIVKQQKFSNTASI
jgi:hypothetical protein